jgi:ATP-dependent protease ClpP protease subunit
VSVHSARLANGPVTSGSLSTFYTCPTGTRTIIKHVIAKNTNAAANRLQVVIKSSGGTILMNFNLFMAITQTAGDTQQLLPWMVMDAGDLLQLAAAANGVEVYVSGTELTL